MAAPAAALLVPPSPPQGGNAAWEQAAVGQRALRLPPADPWRRDQRARRMRRAGRGVGAGQCNARQRPPGGAAGARAAALRRPRGPSAPQSAGPAQRCGARGGVEARAGATPASGRGGWGGGLDFCPSPPRRAPPPAPAAPLRPLGAAIGGPDAGMRGARWGEGAGRCNDRQRPGAGGASHLPRG